MLAPRSVAAFAALLAVLLLATAPRADAAGAAAADLLEDARLAPDDATILLHVRDGAAIRAVLANRPLGRLFTEALAGDGPRAAWTRLAEAAGSDAAGLFDGLLGRRATLILRPAGEDAPLDWALIAEPRDAAERAALDRLRPRRLVPRHGIECAALPEQDLHVGFWNGRCLFGPAGGALLDDVLARCGGARAATLAAHPAVARAAELPDGEIALLVRHAAPLGGWSLAVVDLEGDVATLVHLGAFAASPFERPPPRRDWDCSAVDPFRDAALLAVAEPTEIGVGPMATWIELELDAPLASPDLRRAFGDHRIVVLGETDGRRLPRPTDLLLPTFAVAFPVAHPAGAEAALDRHLRRIVTAINARGEGGYRLAFPPESALTAGAPRHVDLQPLVGHLGGAGFPVMEAVTLDWKVIEGPGGAYTVIASHPDHLADVVAALDPRIAAEAPAAERRGCFASVGTLDGMRIGRQLRTWRDDAAKLAAGDAAQVAAFRATADLASFLAEGIERAEWELTRPSDREMRLEVRAKLAPPASGER